VEEMSSYFPMKMESETASITMKQDDLYLGLHACLSQVTSTSLQRLNLGHCFCVRQTK
jgi:hypothetical protein